MVNGERGPARRSNEGSRPVAGSAPEDAPREHPSGR
jgi:hypothetical protein